MTVPPLAHIEPHSIVKSTLSMLLIMAVLVGCQEQSPPVTTGTTNITPEQFVQLVKKARSKADAWFAALDAAKPSAPLVVDFLRLFPGAVVNYRYFTTNDEPGFDVEVDLHERYELIMQLPVLFDKEGHKVIGYGDPYFALIEVERQEGRGTWYGDEWKFGSNEWNRIVEKGGDFSVIGCAMRTNQPVPGFKDRRRQP